MPAVVRGLIEDRLPEPVVAGIASDHHMSHAPATPGGLPGRGTEARLQLTRALPGQSSCPNGQFLGLLSNRETGIAMIMSW
jgi:hypothetical protein